MADQPDVRVRLSAEGQKEVVDAFRKIQAESEKTGRVGAGGLNKLKDAAAGLARILPALSFAALAGGITLLVKRTLEAADNFSKLSQKTGVAVETLSAYAHGAELSGISTEELATGLGRLARLASDASRGLESAERPFRALGIEFKDARGNLRPLDELLGDVADRFAGMADGTKKAALAQELFGKSGLELIPFLNLGRAGLAELKAAAERLGLVLSKEAAEAAAKFQDSLGNLQAVLTGAGRTLLAELLPGLVSVTIALDQWGQKAGAAVTIGQALAGVLRTAAGAAILLKTGFENIGIVMLGIATASELAIRGKFRAALQELGRSLLDARVNNEAMLDSLETLFTATLPAAGGGMKGLARALNEGSKGMNALASALALADLRMDEFRATAALFNEEKLDFVDTSGRPWHVSLNAIAASWGSLTEKVGEWNLMMAEADLRLDSYRAQTEETTKTLEGMDQAGSILSSGLADLFQGAIVGGKGLQKVLKNLLQSFADMIIKATILRLLGIFLGGTGIGNFLGIPAPTGQAAGGLIHGPGGPTSDAIPAMLSAGEFIVKSRVVQQPGVLSALEALNAGELEAVNRNLYIATHLRARPVRGVRRFAEGGFVDGAGGAVTINNIINAQGASGNIEAQVRRALALERAQTIRHAVLQIHDAELRRP